MTTQELFQAASHIASGMAAAAFAKSQKGPPLTKEIREEIVKLSVRMAREIDAALLRAAE
jgi:hypothetical protein